MERAAGAVRPVVGQSLALGFSEEIALVVGRKVVHLEVVHRSVLSCSCDRGRSLLTRRFGLKAVPAHRENPLDAACRTLHFGASRDL